MFDKEKFIARLKSLRENHPQHKTQREFADFVGISQPTLAGYERGTGKPPVDVLCNIANKCCVSVDWLCGNSDICTNLEQAEKYEDVYEVLVHMRDKLWMNTTFAKNERNQFRASTGWDELTSHFMNEWEPIYKAYQNHSIKKEYYYMIMDDLIKKYNVSLHDEQEYFGFLQANFDDWDSDAPTE